MSLDTPSFNVLPLPSGGALWLCSHPASWPGLTPAHVLGVYKSGGVKTGVSLVSAQELVESGLDDWPALCSAHGVVGWHAPIADRQVPDAAFEIWWQHHAPILQNTLSQGHAVALNCWAGLGRTGTVAARLLMACEGVSADTAINWVRQIRPGSVETASQVAYLQQLPRQAFVTASSVHESLAADACHALSALNTR